MGFARVYSFFELEFFFFQNVSILCAYLNKCRRSSFRNVNADVGVAMQAKAELRRSEKRS